MPPSAQRGEAPQVCGDVAGSLRSLPGRGVRGYVFRASFDTANFKLAPHLLAVFTSNRVGSPALLELHWKDA
jgi:hypothetical protein